MTDPAGKTTSKAGPGRSGFRVRTLLALVICAGALFWAVRSAREWMNPTALLTRQLRSGDVDSREVAAQQLANLGKEEFDVTVPSLIAAMEDEDSGVRAQAASGLGLVGLTAIRAEGKQAMARQVADVLVKALGDSSPEVRGPAAWAIGELAGLPKEVDFPAEPKTVALALVGLLADPEGIVRSSGETALVRVAARAPIEPPPALVEGLNAWPSKESRDAAAVALGAFRAGAGTTVPALIRALDDKEPDVRSSAAQALRGFASDAGSALPMLVKNLADPFNPPPRPEFSLMGMAGTGGGPVVGVHEPTDPAAQAARSIGRIVRAQVDKGGNPPAGVLEALTNALHSDRQALKEAAEEALRRIGPGALSIVPGLIIDLTDSLPGYDPRIGSTAAGLLGDIAPGTDRSGAAFAALNSALDSKDPSTRLAVVTALGKFGPFASSALPHLRRLIEGKDVDVALASAVRFTADRIEGKPLPEPARRKGQGRRGRGGPARP
jgi:HEAT repeat protein